MNGTQVDRACPVCLATGTDKVFENRMSPVGGFDMSYRVASCRGCGFVFANHLPPARRYSGRMIGQPQPSYCPMNSWHRRTKP